MRDHAIEIPPGTITEDHPPQITRYLWGWIGTLLVLVLTLVGVLLFTLGQLQMAQVDTDWVAQDATVVSDVDGTTQYKWTVSSGETVQRTLRSDPTAWFTFGADGNLSLQVNSCDVAAAVLGSSDTLAIWVAPDDPTLAACFPVSTESAAMLIVVGGLLLLFGGLGVLRRFHRAIRAGIRQADAQNLLST